MKNIRLICILLAVPALLLIPYIAMRYTDEVNWTLLDFIVMGLMLLITGVGRGRGPLWVRDGMGSTGAPRGVTSRRNVLAESI